MTTLDRIKAHLTNPANYLKGQHVRNHFVTTNGIKVSIQQSRFHYCSLQSFLVADHLGNNPPPDTSRAATVEMWSCPHLPMLDEYGGESDPYARVPLSVVAAYIDELEKA